MSPPAPKRIIIAGGTGFLGQNLARALTARGDEVTILGRNEPPTTPSNTAPSSPARFIRWDARTIDTWGDALNNADAVVNLVGRSVDCRKTPDHCDEILRSRIEATQILGQAIARATNKPRVWVQMSTAHIYGDPPKLRCDEDSALGYGLAPTVGKAWEQAFTQSKPDNIRGVILRTSFVLGRHGGAMVKLGRLARIGLGGKIASGTQGMSWIHEHDMNALFIRAIDDESMQGTYIATAPNPVSNAEFMRELRRAVRMPIGLPAPAIAVRIAAPLILRTDPELALYGRYCTSKRLAEDHFPFHYPTIREAFTDLYQST